MEVMVLHNIQVREQEKEKDREERRLRAAEEKEERERRDKIDREERERRDILWVHLLGPGKDSKKQKKEIKVVSESDGSGSQPLSTKLYLSTLLALVRCISSFHVVNAVLN